MRLVLACLVLLAAAALITVSPHSAVSAIGAPTEDYTLPDPSNDPGHGEIKPKVDVTLDGPTTQTKTTAPTFLTEFRGPLPQAKLTVIGSGKWYVSIDINTPGFVYIYEYYPRGASGQWMAYKWQVKQSGIWKIGPFSASENETEGQHVYRFWFHANGQWANPTPFQSLIYWDYLKNLPELRIESFDAAPLEVKSGEKVKLSWKVYGAQNIEIPGIGPIQGASDTMDIEPERTTNYVLLATGLDGKQIQSAAVTVTVLTSAPVSANPAQTPTATTPSAPEPTLPDKAGAFFTNPLTLIVLLLLLLVVPAVTTVASRLFAKGKTRKEMQTGTDHSPSAGPVDLSPVKPEGVSRARLLLPNGMEIRLSEDNKSLGRADLARALGLDGLALISQTHFRISNSEGQYFIEDVESINGTVVNGADIRGVGLVALNNGDIIEPASIIQMKFVC